MIVNKYYNSFFPILFKYNKENWICFKIRKQNYWFFPINQKWKGYWVEYGLDIWLIILLIYTSLYSNICLWIIFLLKYKKCNSVIKINLMKTISIVSSTKYTKAFLLRNILVIQIIKKLLNKYAILFEKSIAKF